MPLLSSAMLGVLGMFDRMIIIYGILFLGCALWRERQYVRTQGLLAERILLIFSAIVFLIMKLSYFENVFSSFFQLKAFEALLLGLAYMLFYNLLIREILKRQALDNKNSRVQKRLLYKLPLVGMLSGIALNNYYGQFYTNFLFLIYVIFLLALLYKFFKKFIFTWLGLIFSLLTIALFVIRIGHEVILYDFLSFFSDVIFSLSILVMLEIYHLKGVKKCQATV